MGTAFHAKYFAFELTRTGGAGVERLSRSLFDACVDLNPHQIEAALFAFRSPISKGVLLADEVGLGKTIEAGLVLCQLWAERRRRLLVICPASIRKQWALELAEKFNLPTLILDAQEYQARKAHGIPNPFAADAIVITSMHFASTHAADMRPVPWDLVVIDEAHKLRNAYRSSNRMGQNIRWALEDRRKVLLTATPLQNSLLELYGLSTLIDDCLFGDLGSFRAQFVNADRNLEDLRNRLRTFCIRTLRRQVVEYILLDEILDSPPEPSSDEASQQRPQAPEPTIDRQKLLAEIEELTRYSQWARSIGIDTKSRALVKALEIGFEKMAEMGAAQRRSATIPTGGM